MSSVALHEGQRPQLSVPALLERLRRQAKTLISARGLTLVLLSAAVVILGERAQAESFVIIGGGSSDSSGFIDYRYGYNSGNLDAQNNSLLRHNRFHNPYPRRHRGKQPWHPAFKHRPDHRPQHYPYQRYRFGKGLKPEGLNNKILGRPAYPDHKSSYDHRSYPGHKNHPGQGIAPDKIGRDSKYRHAPSHKRKRHLPEHW